MFKLGINHDLAIWGVEVPVTSGEITLRGTIGKGPKGTRHNPERDGSKPSALHVHAERLFTPVRRKRPPWNVGRTWAAS